MYVPVPVHIRPVVVCGRLWDTWILSYPSRDGGWHSLPLATCRLFSNTVKIFFLQLPAGGVFTCGTLKYETLLCNYMHIGHHRRC